VVSVTLGLLLLLLVFVVMSVVLLLLVLMSVPLFNTTNHITNATHNTTTNNFDNNTHTVTHNNINNNIRSTNTCMWVYGFPYVHVMHMIYLPYLIHCDLIILSWYIKPRQHQHRRQQRQRQH